VAASPTVVGEPAFVELAVPALPLLDIAGLPAAPLALLRRRCV
jgi:hypothetical protein